MSVPKWRAVAKKRNSPHGGLQWNRLGGNLRKFTDSLNGCRGDYAQSSRDWNQNRVKAGAGGGVRGMSRCDGAKILAWRASMRLEN
jgi:hypothetical protein